MAHFFGRNVAKETAVTAQDSVSAITLEPNPSPEYDASKEKSSIIIRAVDKGSETNSANDSEEPQYDFTSEEFANIPELVREVVGFEDDPKLLVITFRSVLLSAFFCIIGSVVSQIS